MSRVLRLKTDPDAACVRSGGGEGGIMSGDVGVTWGIGGEAVM